MAEDGLSNFDLSKIGPGLAATLPSILSALSNGQNPLGSGGYSPRSGTFDGGPPSWFSFGSLFSQVAPMLGGVGGAADMFGATMLPQLMGRLQANSGINALEMQQQRMAMQATMQMNFTGLGTAMAEGMGQDPSSKMGASIAQFGPLLAMLIPGMRDVARMVAPTAMFTGGANVAATAAILDPMSQIQPGQASAMREAMYRLGTHGSLMNTVFTHGMNMDDLAEVGEFTADMRLGATDLDVPEIRRQARERLIKTQFGGKEPTAADDVAGLETSVTQAVAAERLVRGAGLNAQVAQATQGLLGPGSTTAQALQFMNENNLGAQNGEQASKIEETIRRLEALGKQAGVTTEEMRNAGRAMAAQSGGDTLYNAEAYTQSQAAVRAMEMDAGSKGLEVNTAMRDVVTNRINQAAVEQQNGGYAKALAAAYASNPTRQRYLDDIASGNTKDLENLAQDVLQGRTPEGKLASTMINMTRDEQAAYEHQMYDATGGKNVRANQQLSVQTAMSHLGSAFQASFGDLLSDKNFQDELAQGQLTGKSIGSIAMAHGKSIGEATELSRMLTSDNMGRTLMTGFEAGYSSTHLDDQVAQRMRNTQAVDIVSNEAKANGAGQGLFQALRSHSITDLASGLVASGYMQDGSITKIVSAVASMGVTQEVVTALQAKQAAINSLNDANLPEEQKQAAEAKLLKAQDSLDKIGLSESGQSKDSRQVLDWLSAAKKLESDKAPSAGATTTDKPPVTSTATDPNAAGQSTTTTGAPKTAMVETSKAEVRIIVVDNRGQALPDDGYSLAAVKNTGNVSFVKGEGAAS